MFRRLRPGPGPLGGPIFLAGWISDWEVIVRAYDSIRLHVVTVGTPLPIEAAEGSISRMYWGELWGSPANKL